MGFDPLWFAIAILGPIVGFIIVSTFVPATSFPRRVGVAIAWPVASTTPVVLAMPTMGATIAAATGFSFIVTLLHVRWPLFNEK